MKRKLSLLMVLMMVLSLVPANFAFAASDSIVNTVTTSADGTVNFELQIEPKGTGFTTGGVFELRLGENAEWVGAPTVRTGDPADFVRNTSSRAEFRITRDELTTPIVISGQVKLTGASGDQRVTVESITNAGVSRQVLTYAVVTGTGNIVSRTLESKKNVTRAGLAAGAEFEIREASANAMENGTFTLRLPRNFEWNAATTVTLNGASLSRTIDGRNMVVTVTGTNTSVIDRILVVPQFTMNRDASFGDVFVQIFDNNTTNINPEDVIVAEYRDFGVTLSVDTVRDIVAGQDKTNREQRVKVTLEPSGSSFNLNRMVDFSVSGGKVRLIGSNPTNNTTLSGISSTVYDDEFELMFNHGGASSASGKVEFELLLKADWDKVGEMTLTARGAGVDEQTVKIANVLAPATISADIQNLKIGVQGQAGSEITITETRAGSLKPGFYVIDFDRANFGVTFTRPAATVTAGDMEVARNINNDGSRMWFEVKGESRTASTIVLSGYQVSLDRTVPEGELNAKLAFFAESGVSSSVRDARLNDVRDHSKITNFVLGRVITAAPDTTRPTTVFTLGSTVYTIAGEERTLDAAPYISNNRTMLPIGTVAQVVGATVNYSAETRTAVFLKDNLVVSMNLDTNVLLVNGVPVMMDAKPEIVNSRAFVPVVFVAQAFGIQNNTQIVYDATARTVTMFPEQP